MKRRRYLNDLILLAACLLIAGLIFVIVRVTVKDGSVLSVMYDSDIAYSHPLDREGYLIVMYDDGLKVMFNEDYDEDPIKEAETGGADINVIKITDGHADMIYANCPDLICVHTMPVSRVGSSIICLPHKITVTVSDNKYDLAKLNNETDAVTW
ncbi:MAG: NusG domain II-containing protein [Lachnospiraceae bacterium]|nr:NusG domain II-containing protein [Lachnospiraceae bacterium]